MGLDNGILLKIKDSKKFGSDRLPVWMPRQEWEDKNEYDWEILYWRKCWNVRGEILDYFWHNDIATRDNNEYEWAFSLEQFSGLCDKLNACYNRKWWKENDSSIWSWDECGANYKAKLRLARKLIRFLKDKDPDSYEIYFYDSY